MKKILSYFIITLLTFSIIGCSAGNHSGDPGMEGYVMSVENGRMLVVDTKSQDFSSTGGVKEFYNAIVFSNAPKDVQVGQKVQVWFDAVAESYPGQSSAKKVKILPSNQPANANLAEDAAIRKALDSQSFGHFGVLVIKSVSYDESSDVWEIVLKQEEEEWTVQVEDE